MPRAAALTVGQALAGLTAHSQKVFASAFMRHARIGRTKYRPDCQRASECPRDVHLLGRLVHVADTPAGPRAIAKGELVKPEVVKRYLRGKFGDTLDAAPKCRTWPLAFRRSG